MTCGVVLQQIVNCVNLSSIANCTRSGLNLPTLYVHRALTACLPCLALPPPPVPWSTRALLPPFIMRWWCVVGWMGQCAFVCVCGGGGGSVALSLCTLLFLPTLAP